MPLTYGRLGIRTCWELNVPFLAKLEWRMINEENALWAKILHGKYATYIVG